MCGRKIYTLLIVAKREKAAWHNLIVPNYNITEVITIDFDFDCLIFTPEEGTIPDSLLICICFKRRSDKCTNCSHSLKLTFLIKSIMYPHPPRTCSPTMLSKVQIKGILILMFTMLAISLFQALNGSCFIKSCDRRADAIL